jgi:hypothetical protein
MRMRVVQALQLQVYGAEDSVLVTTVAGFHQSLKDIEAVLTMRSPILG